MYLSLSIYMYVYHLYVYTYILYVYMLLSLALILTIQLQQVAWRKWGWSLVATRRFSPGLACLLFALQLWACYFGCLTGVSKSVQELLV